MATIIINEKTTAGKKMFEYLKTQNYVSLVKEKKTTKDVPNNTTLKAIKDAQEGKNLNRYKSSKDMFEKLGI